MIWRLARKLVMESNAPTWSAIASRNLRTTSAASSQRATPPSSKFDDDTSGNHREQPKQHERPTSKQQHDAEPDQQKPQYERNPDHIPDTGADERRSYVLTLRTTSQIHREANRMRDQFFPKHLNKIPAHISLFRALPGSKLPMIVEDVKAVVADHEPFPIRLTKPMRMSKGVAVRVNDMPHARAVHSFLQERWISFLSVQDKGPLSAHYTVMNKVEDEQRIADAMKEIAQKVQVPDAKATSVLSGQVVGLTLYEYDKGFWKFVHHYDFTGTKGQ